MRVFMDKYGMRYELVVESADYYVLRYATKGYSFTGKETVRRKEFCRDWREL